MGQLESDAVMPEEAPAEATVEVLAKSVEGEQVVQSVAETRDSLADFISPFEPMYTLIKRHFFEE